MGQKYTIKFKVTDLTAIQNDEVDLEVYFKDLLVTSILPALGMELAPLTLEVKKARKQAKPPSGGLRRDGYPLTEEPSQEDRRRRNDQKRL